MQGFRGPNDCTDEGGSQARPSWRTADESDGTKGHRISLEVGFMEIIDREGSDFTEIQVITGARQVVRTHNIHK